MTDEPTYIGAYKPHVFHEVICVKCQYRYVATAPADLLLKQYQCGDCKEIGGIILTGQPTSGVFYENFNGTG